MERVLEAERALGNRGRDHVVQSVGLPVDIHQTFDELSRDVFERRRGTMGERLLDDEAHVVDVTIVKGREDRAFVGEVLIQRSDADTRYLRDAIGG